MYYLPQAKGARSCSCARLRQPEPRRRNMHTQTQERNTQRTAQQHMETAARHTEPYGAM